MSRTGKILFDILVISTFAASMAAAMQDVPPLPVQQPDRQGMATGKVPETVSNDRSGINEQLQQGNKLLAAGEFAKGAEAFNKVLAIQPGNNLAKLGLAMALARLGQLDEAEKQLQQLFAVSPDGARILHELGMIQMQRGDYEKAIANFKEGIRFYEQKRH